MATTFEIPAKQVPRKIATPKSVSMKLITKNPVDKAHKINPVESKDFTPIKINEFFVRIEQNKAER